MATTKSTIGLVIHNVLATYTKWNAPIIYNRVFIEFVKTDLLLIRKSTTSIYYFLASSSISGFLLAYDRVRTASHSYFFFRCPKRMSTIVDGPLNTCRCRKVRPSPPTHFAFLAIKCETPFSFLCINMDSSTWGEVAST